MISGLGTDPAKCKVAKVCSEFSEQDKIWLSNMGFDKKCIVKQMTFLGHTISLSERSDSETCLDKLSRKLTKLSFMGLAKARRAMYLTRFGKISITRALICSYWNYFASHFPLKKQHSKFAQRNIDDYITYKCHFLAGEAKYAPLRYGGGVFCPSTNP